MSPKSRKWFRGLFGGIIGSAASSASAAMGLAGASAIGVDVKPLDLKQLGAVFLTGAICGAVLFLKQSPIPPSEDDTTIIPKP